MEHPENTTTNKYAVKRIESKQSIYEYIYSLGLVKLETLKAYIEIYPKSKFICPLSSLQVYSFFS